MADYLTTVLRLYEDKFDGNNHALETIHKKENTRYLSGASYDRLERPARDQRDVTLPPGDTNPDREFDKEDGLELKFSDITKHGVGWMLGSDANTCDIVLPNLASTSRQHCLITFDGHYRLIVRDMSSYGTRVVFDGNHESSKFQKDFTWVIGNDDFLDLRERKIVLQLHNQISFRLVIPRKPASATIRYAFNVGMFVNSGAARTNSPYARFNHLHEIIVGNIHRAQNPEFVPVYVIGRSSHATVDKVWDVSTGKFYARKFSYRLDIDFSKEAAMLRRLKHDHINPLIWIDTPVPRQMVTEYQPLTNLLQVHKTIPLAQVEIGLALQQGLSALTYLHEQDPPIAHRDIKPKNILVSSRNPMRIKLTDFYSASEGETCTSRCGTDYYKAPELHKAEDLELKNPCALDVWSLGIVGVEFAYGFPELVEIVEDMPGISWCEEVVAAVGRQRMTERDFLAFDPVPSREIVLESMKLHELLSVMLILDADARGTARECLNITLRGRDLFDFHHASPHASPHAPRSPISISDSPEAMRDEDYMSDEESSSEDEDDDSSYRPSTDDEASPRPQREPSPEPQPPFRVPPPLRVRGDDAGFPIWIEDTPELSDADSDATLW